MSISKYIPELLDANVITPETAEKIEAYYRNKGAQSSNRQFIVFGILGALLIGLGIILVIAHNWDELSRTAKCIFAFLPLVIGQATCLYVIVKKISSIAWREAATTFLFMAVGASISLVSQIYNIPGDLRSFLFTWLLLCLPLIYIMHSAVASILFVGGITWYAVLTGYWSYKASLSPYLYWLLLMSILPFYFILFRKNPKGNFTNVHHWVVPLSLIISLGTVAQGNDAVLYIGYFSLFGLLYLVGSFDFFKAQRAWVNGYLIMGSLGTMSLLIGLTFDWFWRRHREQVYNLEDLIVSPEFIASAIFSIAASVVLYSHVRTKPVTNLPPQSSVFLLFILIFIIGSYSSLSVVLINIIVLAIGILIIREGARLDHLGVLNYGLMIITILVICRFFDTDLSFVMRGLMFIGVGLGFFMTNYRMLKRRKANE